jgi:hypothetical protein
MAATRFALSTRIVRMPQAQGQAFLNQPRGAELLAGGQSLGFHQQIVVEIERGAHRPGSMKTATSLQWGLSIYPCR